MARQNAVKRQEYAEKSKAAYSSGNGAKAKVYNSSKPPNEIDLHGLKVREALDITRERLARFIRNKETNLIIIVGRGNNSVNGIAKIKPAVIELVKEYRIKATPNKPNQGCIFVEPLPSNQGFDFSWIDGFFRGIFQKLFSTIFGPWQ
ncbi:hypothetical protein BGZ80_010221 [Entomortierella chlamydospora]|uniref:Smr domain-containing protein n=1 Tax=Entomortierella chlamydospora TaxID=101097 RepID=A0A9P6N4C4_9FUNG|nr:hypothetical protein BGZ80_010221 [Entomortierella chlamydospora]